MSRNIRPGAGAFPSRPTRSRQNDDYSYASDSGGGYYGNTGGSSNNNNYSGRGGDDDGYYSQSQRSYGGGSSGRRNDGGYPDRGGYSRSNNNTLSTGSTTSTNSSSGSSLLDRMKVRSADTSARTSIDDDYNERTPARGGGWARKPAAVQENMQKGEEPDEPAARDPNSAGNTLWGRITAATANLTINVSKAWENGVNLQDGEETPPGGETRLTRALKAYYIERARTPADLPPWLFEEHERRPQAARPPPRDAYQERDQDRAGGRRNNMVSSSNRGRRNNMVSSSNRGRNYDDEYEQPPPPQANRGALRDIYDSAAAPNHPKVPAGRTLAPSSYRDDDSGNVSRATSRLQALRDAKRLQPTSTGTSAGGRYDDQYDDGGRGGRGSFDQGRGSGGGRYPATDDEAYGGYGSGRRPTARSEGGWSGNGRPSFDDGGRRPPPRGAMGLPSRPQRGGGY